MKKDRLLNIAEKYGTPSFLFDEVDLRNRMREIYNIFGDGIELCYSIKANPFLIPAMDGCCERLEVCSPGELRICEDLGVLPSKILYSGVNKEREDIREAIRYGVEAFTAESLKQVQDINKVAIQEKKKAKLFLRLSAGSQFGMSKADLFCVIYRLEEYEGFVLQGIHYHAGTQRKRSSEHRGELAMLKELFREINAIGKVRLIELEYGPGLPFSYFRGEGEQDSLQPAKELALLLREAQEWCRLTIEMGRFFVSPCGYYLTKAVDEKTVSTTNYCILDGGMNHLNYYGQLMGMKIPYIQHLKKSVSKEEKEWCLCGSLCTLADVIVRKVSFEGLETNDYLAFENTGAYTVTEGIHLFLSRTMPRILLKKEDGRIVVARDFIESSALNKIFKKEE